MGDMAQGFSEQVCKVVSRWDIFHRDVTHLDMLADEVMMYVNMFDADIVLCVLGKHNHSSIVSNEMCRF
jgi:hypothetical protein